MSGSEEVNNKVHEKIRIVVVSLRHPIHIPITGSFVLCLSAATTIIIIFFFVNLINLSRVQMKYVKTVVSTEAEALCMIGLGNERWKKGSVRYV